MRAYLLLNFFIWLASVKFIELYCGLLEPFYRSTIFQEIYELIDSFGPMNVLLDWLYGILKDNQSSYF